jgi:protocatechuate 3,4-dioxygenase beta subunit
VPGRRKGQLFVRDPRWTTLLTGVPVDGRSGHACQIVVAPAVELAGVVLDEYGAPLADALVRIVPADDLRARLARVLDFSASVSWRVASDADGSFHFPSAPAIAAAVLRAELTGYDVHEEPAPLAARANLVLVLARPAQGEVLRGLVVDAGGSPVEDALVAHGLDTVRTDEEGRFAFDLDDPRSRTASRDLSWLGAPAGLLRAVKRGYLPAELRADGRGDDGRPRWPRPLVLHLGTETLAIGGRVVDEHRRPLEDVRVWIADPSLFGIARGRSADDLDFVVTESLLTGEGSGWHWTETDDDGAFELEGLAARDYAVAAMDPESLLRVVEPFVAAGRRDVELVLQSGALFPRLVGHVIDGRGNPVPDVDVYPMCDAFELKSFAGEVFRTHHGKVDGTQTDAEGRFELERVPRDLAYLRLQGADTIPLEWGRGVAGGLAMLVDDEGDVVITVERRCHFRVELAVPAEADELGVLDANDRVLIVSEFLGNGRREDHRHPLVEGRSNTLAVGDRATTLVLYRGGAEVRRVPLELTPGSPLSLRL